MSLEGPERSDTRRTGWYVLWASAVCIGAVGLLAALTHQPWVFPSLGPTAYVLLTAPYAAGASPRNIVCGHAIGIVAGALAVAVVGLGGVPADLEDVTPGRIGAVMLALALTLAAMTWLRVPHAPAGATTLIVALGLLYTARHLVLMLVSVVVMVVVAYVVNRIHGDRPPLWTPRQT